MDKSMEFHKAYKAVVTTVPDTIGDGGIDMEDVLNLFELGENELVELEGDGDFRSEECLALLDEADIVATNPPFSLFREYVATLTEHKKKFIIVGNINAVTYKEFFPLLKDNDVRLGYESLGEFSTPDGTMKNLKGSTRWYTNLDIKKSHEELILVKKYAGHEDEYPKYDNYDAINVNKVINIPCDYAGVMGVPITFLDKYNPEQFEIIGHEHDLNGNGGKESLSQFMVNGKGVYKRILIRNKHPELSLVKKYAGHEDEYPKYDNYDAIEVSKVADIPFDYAGVMGVPITFLDKYNPDQFEILGISGELANPLLIDGKRKTGRFYINGRRLYDRIAIRNKHPELPKEEDK